jgi:hypothetical protein
VNFIDPLNHIIDDQFLDDLVLAYLIDSTKRGEIFTMYYLRSKGYYVTREQLRESILRIDSDGRYNRRPGPTIARVVYSAPGPGFLFHTDGTPLESQSPLELFMHIFLIFTNI